MNIIIYGPHRPKIGFQQSPDGSITFKIENDLTIEIELGQEKITWKNLLSGSDIYALFNTIQEEQIELFRGFISDKIVDLTGSPSERKFLIDYMETCIDASSYFEESVWEYPALIPQVWVNWMHYDAKDSSRAERAKKEPFRVDFMVKDPQINSNLVIFEIDGSSHFVNQEAYTQHLQKDRWLRKQGWDVIRFSNLEVTNYSSFNDFFHELTDKYINIPF